MRPPLTTPPQPEVDTNTDYIWKTVKLIHISHINTGLCSGLMYHLDEVHNLLAEKSPDVLACSETWLQKGYDKGLIETDSYAFHSRLKPSDWPGAQDVGLFVSRNYDFSARPDLDHKI